MYRTTSVNSRTRTFVNTTNGSTGTITLYPSRFASRRWLGSDTFAKVLHGKVLRGVVNQIFLLSIDAGGQFPTAFPLCYGYKDWDEGRGPGCTNLLLMGLTPNHLVFEDRHSGII